MTGLRHVFVTQDYAPDLGGMARRHVELCRRLAPPDAVVVSTVDAPGAAGFDAGEPYTIRRQPFPFREAKRFVRQMTWADALTRDLEPGRTILHVGNIRPCGYAAAVATRRRKVPYIVYVNGGDLLREREKMRGALKRWAARDIYARSAGIVANSRYTGDLAREIMSTAGVRVPPPVAVIDLGTDPVQFHPGRNTHRLRDRFGIGDAPLLVSIARLVPHKGQDVAIDALALLPAHVRYLVIGEGPDRDRLAAHARSRGVQDRVILAGALGDAEIAEAYATATVYVGLSRLDSGINVEGFGISFVEASASGAPVVAGDSGGIRSAVRDGETGFVVPPTDAAGVAAAVRALLDTPGLRETMGAAGRRAVETHFNWDRMARETRDFVAQVTGLAP